MDDDEQESFADTQVPFNSCCHCNFTCTPVSLSEDTEQPHYIHYITSAKLIGNQLYDSLPYYSVY